MGAPWLARRLWTGLWNRENLGRIVIKFYKQGGEASISVDPLLVALSRRYWHWLYLQHLAESLAATGETQERTRLLVAARAMAEDFVSRSNWPCVIGEGIADAGAGAADIVPERAGGVAVTAHVVQRGGGMPTVRLNWSPRRARDRIASSNLVLLVHVMRGATHPLEQYEIFKKIALFVEHSERAGYPRETVTLKAGALFAVVHADVTEMASPGGLVRHKAGAPPHAAAALPARDRLPTVPAGLRLVRTALVSVRARLVSVPAAIRTGQGAIRTGLTAVRAGLAATRASLNAVRVRLAAVRADLTSVCRRLASPDPFWKRSGAAIGAAAAVWAALVFGALFLPRLGGFVPAPRPMASLPVTAPLSHVAQPSQGRELARPQTRSALPPPATPPPAASAPEVDRPQPVATGRPGGVAALQRPRPVPDREGSELPRFRVVSGPLALDVAEHRSRVLAEQGVDAFVRERAGKLGRLQYGAYRSREVAEEDAKRFRAQGYTAVVVPY